MNTEEIHIEESPNDSAPSSQSDTPEHLWAALSATAMVRFLLLFASGWALIQLLAYFELLVVVFVTATILAFLLNHPVTWLSRWLPRGTAAIAVFLACLTLAVGLSATLGAAVLAQGQQLTASFQEFSDSVLPWFSGVENLLEAWNIPIDLAGLEPQLQNQAVTVLTAGLGLLQSTLANLVIAILIAVVTLFMMLDGDKIWWWLLNNLPIYHKERFNSVIQHNLLGFFWGRLLLSIFSGCLPSWFSFCWGYPIPLSSPSLLDCLTSFPVLGPPWGWGWSLYCCSPKACGSPSKPL